MARIIRRRRDANMHRWLRSAAVALSLIAVLMARPASTQQMRYGRAASCPDFHAYTAMHWSTTLGAAAAGSTSTTLGAEGKSSSPAGTPPPPQRFLVTWDMDGLADRLVNAASAFLVALLTDRALCILPSPPVKRGDSQQPGLEVTFEAPFVDWTCPGAPWKAEGLSTSELNAAKRAQGDLSMHDSSYYRTFVLSDLRGIPGNSADVMRVLLHRGISVGLFDNVHHRQELLAMGLRPETAFGCVLSYLFRPSRLSLGLVPRDLMSPMMDERIIKIGIQIRAGDLIIKGNDDDENKISDDGFDRVAKPYFDCAADLEADLRLHSGKDIPILWYLMTDSIAIRHRAVERYTAAKLLTFNATSIEFFRLVSEDGLRHTMMEHWLLQQAHYHVITAASGIGRTAAYAGLRHQSVFSMDIGSIGNIGKEGSPSVRRRRRGCTLDESDGLREVSVQWSGI